MTITAKWEIKKSATCQLTFDANDGGMSGDAQYEGVSTYTVNAAQDSVVVLEPTAVRDGYCFAGWSYDKEGQIVIANNRYNSRKSARHSRSIHCRKCILRM